MLLAIDAGNTSVTVGLFAAGTDGGAGELLGTWRLRSDPRMTSDELALVIRGFLTGPGTEPGFDPAAVTGVTALSTVPELLRSLRAMAPRYYPGAQHVILEPGVKTGVPLHVDNPREVGTDRVANAAGAFEVCGRSAGTPCIVVDFGTSTRVDVVSAKGEFLGGAIAPGVGSALDALAERTVALRRVELVPPRSVVGKNTVEALQSGIIYGFAGLVDALVRRALETVPDARVIATGGYDDGVAAECATITDRRADLTLQGLRAVYLREIASRATRAERKAHPRDSV
ncbi:Type III pantothenate kinase OS=Tsukamurella paurometabola (strain ATCC 8368 / DSM / CCUG 35730/ CIP 100753 / JCM 10117 / KCTC 9821 / NBRC 16120 / NCIMB 702349 / NCTC 13040) OX=521096 GN=coaX PE=3 SV=1 [Tsukamurella paurometabola]|uniref:Type III pantothenate kinase n=1 Tax=Tsukamurella paurometabola (strain ATCC 8368 / DSM 20162 / CCUG 35730 / CIP 100753 / JCM 10117 / KCTC 9821 / NBRC 16120 / NCIMB 702349 / NCTC 13040) TaxID=521096 RepID=D5USE2_TSUPD|nr:type III pantothenate kinase [Tsukamurella paurometabola]ADG77209.1 putative transcriptional acitvator, Baf family [Tsukamurella paurometabola DSM 20162]SUP43161.1 Type III pantothenate kinase [Tsukamurella paurometabola]